jgi:hypothetical protein
MATIPSPNGRDPTLPICSPFGDLTNVAGSELDPSPIASSLGEKYLTPGLLESSYQAFGTSDFATLPTLDGGPNPKVQQLSTTRLLMAHIG